MSKTVYLIFYLTLFSTTVISQPPKESSYEEIYGGRRSPIQDTRVSFTELSAADQVRECFVYRHKKKLLVGAASIVASGITWVVRPDYAIYCFLGAIAGPVVSCCTAAIQDAKVEDIGIIPR